VSAARSACSAAWLRAAPAAHSRWVGLISSGSHGRKCLASEFHRRENVLTAESAGDTWSLRGASAPPARTSLATIGIRCRTSEREVADSRRLKQQKVALARCSNQRRRLAQLDEPPRHRRPAAGVVHAVIDSSDARGKALIGWVENNCRAIRPLRTGRRHVTRESIGTASTRTTFGPSRGPPGAAGGWPAARPLQLFPQADQARRTPPPRRPRPRLVAEQWFGTLADLWSSKPYSQMWATDVPRQLKLLSKVSAKVVVGVTAVGMTFVHDPGRIICPWAPWSRWRQVAIAPLAPGRVFAAHGLGVEPSQSARRGTDQRRPGRRAAVDTFHRHPGQMSELRGLARAWRGRRSTPRPGDRGADDPAPPERAFQLFQIGIWIAIASPPPGLC
jgi:hypothetical protein